ncbi:aldose-1-epimerase [Arthrobacter sp. zg-Y20]|uniref:aldose-1-epimerase n=1 Tax=unclassified Arthrobacter TaxID=235627 RepID=UPI001D13DE1E|nr:MULTISPECIES: aldose-1-epimerase [unclassified Arthrobacter]MCC3276508.1 aldose-1-epimerase [Arthrobacter sp. zg-Y20]MDK1316668.1 aldose-1-epimerase [Arthrobacter sp. zg.Y20]WIB06909.1 aldose-1-epimerase [Arthrobacter sp. zg-Y20]
MTNTGFHGTGPNGSPIELAAGSYRATIYPVGATLAALTRDGRHLVLPLPEDTVPHAYTGKVLMPWPNRIVGGRYSFEGSDYQVPVNEPETGMALHGLVCWDEWQVAEAAADRVVLRHRLMGQPGYPFTLELEAVYALDAEAGLSVELAARNAGASAAPYGVSAHPYLTADLVPVDRCVLEVPAAQVLGTLEQPGRPLDLAELQDVKGTALAFTADGPIGARTADHAYAGLPDGEWQVRLTDPETGVGSVLSAVGKDAPWLQIYSGEQMGRLGVAAEPMTCPPDAFNSGEGLIVLAPGEEHRLGFGIAAA